MDTKLTVRVPRDLLENAKRYAKQHHTTLTDLISVYLQQLPGEGGDFEQTPLVRRLTGSISSRLSAEDYKKHLEEKYGRK
jgi:hypothetical protein